MNNIECPIEGNTTYRVFQKDGYWIRECPVCHLQQVEITASQEHIAKVYGDSYFVEGGAGYSDYTSEAEIITAHGKQYGKLLSKFMQPGKVLDVGAAAGYVLKGLSEYGWDGMGVEPNTTMVEYGRTNTGVTIEAGTLERFESNEKFDLVNMVQVLPHFYNLRQALCTAANFTNLGGYWLIETWNKDSLISRILGQYWHEYSPPSTLYFFSPETLRLLVKQFGLKEVARGRPSKKIKIGHAKSLIQSKLQNSKLGKLGKRLLEVLPDNIVIPYPSFDLFWGLYKYQGWQCELKPFCNSANPLCHQIHSYSSYK